MPDAANSPPLIGLIGWVTLTPLAARAANEVDGLAESPAPKVPSLDQEGFPYCHEPMKALLAFGTTNAFAAQDGALRREMQKGGLPFCLFPNLRSHCPRCPLRQIAHSSGPAPFSLCSQCTSQKKGIFRTLTPCCT